MRTLAAAVVAAVVSLTAACGGDDPEPAAQPETATQDSSPSASPSTESTTADGSAAQKLTGTVGTEAEPDAFTITLTDSSGKAVTTLPAGDYQIAISDLSAIHDFHLTGPGVDETTTVPETTEVTWDVTLQAGSYTFKCDPHPPMTGTLKVT